MARPKKRKYTKRAGRPPVDRAAYFENAFQRVNSANDAYKNEIERLRQRLYTAESALEIATLTINEFGDAVAQNSRSLDLVEQAARNNANQARDFLLYLNAKKNRAGVDAQSNVVDLGNETKAESKEAQNGRVKYGS